MRALRSWPAVLGTLALAGQPAAAGAQPVGDEFQVNTYTTGSQSPSGERAVAADASGNFVVVWDGGGQGDNNSGIFGQRYDSAGGVLGTEFRVNSFTAFAQSNPSVASDASGNFVVVWVSNTQDGSGLGIFGQRYDGAGGAQGDEFRVNSYTTEYQWRPSVASDASGNVVVVWEDQGDQDGSGVGIFGQRYDGAGGAQGDEFRVNSYTTGHQQRPSVASDASGNFVVVWQSLTQDGNSPKIFGQRYDSGGVAQGDEFRVSSTTDEKYPSVASDASGNFVVVWRSTYFGYSNSRHIYGQRYDSGGVAQGDEFRVDSVEGYFPSVASDASGNFVVVWEIEDDVFGQRYDNAGARLGSEFRVNAYTTSSQNNASVAADASGNVVAVWQSAGQDGNSGGVFGQRFDFAGETIEVVSPNTNVKWRIGSFERIKWTHSLGRGATFRIELDREDDGEYEELIAGAAPADAATRGHFGWTVTGPRSATARVRVSWTDDPGVSDVSDVTFQIRPAPLSATESLLLR